MKNAITYILAATIVLAFSGFAADQNSGGQKTKKKGPPNTTRTNGGNNGKTNRKTVRKPTNGGQNNNGKTNGGNNGGKNNNGKTNGGNNGNNNNKPTQKKKKHPSLSELLGLKGEVAKKFEELNKRLRETVKKIAESKMSNEDKAVRIRVAHQKYRKAIEELLSEEQLAKLRLIHLKRAESHKKHHHHFGPFVAKALKLTEEQIKKLAAVRHHACKKRYEVLSNKNLSEKEKKAALKEIHHQVRARTAEILTEEQLAMLKEINAKAKQMSGSNGKKKSTGNPE